MSFTAHRHKIDSDGVVPAVGYRELDLRTHAVGAGDQHRVPIAVQRWLEQRAESADSGDDALARGVPRNPVNARDEILAATDVDTSVPVAEAFCCGGRLIGHAMVPDSPPTQA